MISLLAWGAFSHKRFLEASLVEIPASLKAPSAVGLKVAVAALSLLHRRWSVNSPKLASYRQGVGAFSHL